MNVSCNTPCGQWGSCLMNCLMCLITVTMWNEENSQRDLKDPLENTMKMNWINKKFLLISEQHIMCCIVGLRDNVILWLVVVLFIIQKYKSRLTLGFRAGLPGVINVPLTPVPVTHTDR